MRGQLRVKVKRGMKKKKMMKMRRMVRSKWKSTMYHKLICLEKETQRHSHLLTERLSSKIF
jgi:hypothetical protein